ncbi:unnamed protein product [Phytophthora lilii]|uniref:Unnamed protein product n=1 Tax=Phytophthora lilii TaxID=2077276 RepID=A0A9W6U9T1_9STRA|nr:unnamed protein product [Phytophthora lilii]
MWNGVESQRSKNLRETVKQIFLAQISGNRDDGTSCWDIPELFRHVDICQRFKSAGVGDFPTIALLARVWLGRAVSTAFQERGISSGSIVMRPYRSRTDRDRAEKQMLLKHNADEMKETILVLSGEADFRPSV